MSKDNHGSIPSLPARGIFRSLSDEQRAFLGGQGKFRLLAPGAVLLAQGESRNSLFFVLEGNLEVSYKSSMREVGLGMIKAGESVGEMNVFDPLSASATVKAHDTARVWEIDGDHFRAFLNEFPPVGIQILTEITAILTRRIRRITSKMIREADASIVIHEWDS